MPSLQQQFGQIDIYLFDQLLRGNIAPGVRILDTGCGGGRNLVYLLREGYEVFAADANPSAIDQIHALAAALAPALPAENFRVEPVEAMSSPTLHDHLGPSKKPLTHSDTANQRTGQFLRHLEHQAAKRVN
jgi:tellurite methyltransferase